MEQQTLIPQLFRTEYRKITAVLCKLFGIAHMEDAEDIASDTFLLAAETWGIKGLPANPTAWLYTVAKNKARDYLKRTAVFAQKISPQLLREQEEIKDFDIDLSDKNILDSQLQMMFAICNPVINTEAQIGLSLRILCGFGIDEIADAFLTNKDTINKRLFRAKEKLRIQNATISFPAADEVNERLQPVLTTLYLLFNEGYYSTSGNTTLRKDLCVEAMRLTVLLTENELTNKPFVNALLALMCFHASRFEARVNENGEMIRYDEQDTSLWNTELVEKGNYYLQKSAQGNNISKFHAEAWIAYWHTFKNDSQEKWDNILQLYNQLLIIEYSPMAALTKTYALYKAYGKGPAIIEAEKLALVNNHLYHCLLGELYTGVENTKALQHYTNALGLAKSITDKTLITNKMEQLK